MKRFLFSALCILILLMSAGCANYSGVDESLNEVKIENKLPEISNIQYLSLESANDEIYEQQIAFCKILSEAYDKTYYAKFYKKGMKRNKVADMCNSYRKDLNEEALKELYKNLYNIVAKCDDCTNKDAFVEKAGNDVLGFYDAYNKYLNADDKEKELCNILTNYSERKNVLALSFLERNRNKVFDAAVHMISNNAHAEDSYRYYLNKNNYIISALNDVYDGVPSQYADKISAATKTLSVNLLNSLNNLSDTERNSLMDQLNIETPSPSPSAAPATQTPTHTPVPMQTPTPARTIAPATQTPVRTAVPATNPPAATSVPQTQSEPEEDDRPSYSFSADE